MSNRFSFVNALRGALLETAYMVSLSLVISIVLGTLLGYCLYATSNRYLMPNRYANSIIGFTVNMVRSMPFIILLVAVLPLSKVVAGTMVGPKAIILPLVISSTAFFSRLSESAFRGVNKGVVEYALSAGANNAQIFFTILLPEAGSTLISAVTVATIALLGSSAMAGTVGGGGVGHFAISYGYERFQTRILLVCIAVLAIIVQVIQFIGDLAARRADKS
ncbi:MAG: ABC transporter permease [Synergistaceae bacterium]|jgi:D-methionine transport system permease protein|nr:ABC transporter permease [Synergistaceae bacterium]